VRALMTALSERGQLDEGPVGAQDGAFRAGATLPTRGLMALRTALIGAFRTSLAHGPPK